MNYDIIDTNADGIKSISSGIMRVAERKSVPVIVVVVGEAEVAAVRLVHQLPQMRVRRGLKQQKLNLEYFRLFANTCKM